MHAHDVKNAEEFKDQRVCVVGASYSAEDIASMVWKNKCKSVVCSYRTAPMTYEWPANFTTKPLLVKTEGNTAYFKDGTSEEVDAIIMCTGYQHNMTFMEDKLRLECGTELYDQKSYKSIVWQENPKLFHLGMVDQWYTYTLFDVQAFYCRDVIMGKIALPSKEDREADIKKWAAKLSGVGGDHTKGMLFQGEYLGELVSLTDHIDIKIETMSQIFSDWMHCKEENILTFRDK